MDVARPLWLLALPLLVAAWWLLQRSRGGPAWAVSPRRRRLSAALRLLTLVALLLVLAGLRQKLPSERITVTFLVDHSLSTRRQEAAIHQFLDRALQRRPDAVEVQVVYFAGEAVTELAPTRSPYVPRISHSLDRDQTDLAAALQYAAAAQPPGRGGRVVLLSDGRETRGSLLDAAEALTSSGLELDTVPLPQSEEPEALVEELRCPARVRQKTPFDVVATIYSNQATPASLQLFRGGLPAGTFPVRLDRGRNVFMLPQTSDKAGALRYDLQLSVEHDAERANNKASGLTVVEGPSRVLVVAARENPVAAMLQSRGMEADRLSPAELPDDLGEWLAYQSVVLDNVPSTELTTAQLEGLTALVRDAGLGLVMLGGPDSFAAGGYSRTPLTEALPVDLRVQRRRLTPPTAQLHIIDKSGSMSETTAGMEHMALAREASIGALEILTPEDLFGVIGFDDAFKWVVRLQPAARPKAIAGEIATLRAGGGTDLYPALQAGIRELSKSALSSRHILVLSDGATAPANFDNLMAQARQQNIRVTTVAVGQGADIVFLTRLAQLGKGRCYVADSPQALPRIFARETMLAARSAFDERPARLADAGAHPILQGVDPASAPPLLGHDLVMARGAPHQVLIQTTGGDPVLAVGRYGLGKSVAYTGDDGLRWSHPWAAREDFGQMLVQAVRWSLPSGEAGPLQLSTEVDKLGRLQVRAQVPPELAPQGLVASLIGADGKSRTLELLQVAPDRYEGLVELPSSGTGVLHVGTPDARVGVTQPLAARPSPELGGVEVQRGLLQQAAQLGGGRFQPEPGDVFRALQHAPNFYQDLERPLLLLALLTLLAEVAVRRVPRFSWRPVGSSASGASDAAVPVSVASLRERVKKSATRAGRSEGGLSGGASSGVGSVPLGSSREGGLLPLASSREGAEAGDSSGSAAPSEGSTLAQLRKAKDEARKRKG